ncbi:MAG: multidrug efflux MFS transporter [Anaerolineae bacterium]
MPRDLLVMTLTMIVANITSNMFFPFEALYLGSLGATIQDIGVFFTLQTVMSILFRVGGGWVSDNLGRLQTIAVGSLFGLAAYLGYTLAADWRWAMIGAVLGAAGSALVAPSFQAFTAESAPEGAVGSTFGLVEGLFLTCQIIGPIMGGLLVENYGYKVMMWVATGIFVIATILRLWLARGRRFVLGDLKQSHLGRDLKALVSIIIAGGLVTWLFVVDGLRDASSQLMMPFLPDYVTRLGGQSEGVYGLLFSGMTVVTVLAMVPGGMLADRHGERWGIALGGGISSISLVVMILWPTTAGFAVAFALFGIAGALVSPAFSALLSKAVPRGSLGMIYGLFWSALGVVAIPSPYLGGLLYEGIAPQAPMWISALVIALTVPIALWRLRRPPDAAQASLPIEPVEAAPSQG